MIIIIRIQHFINRKEELNFLNEKYSQADAQLIIIYGRRRVGKTQLLLEFAKNKKNIYYLAEKTTIKRNIDKLKSEIADHLDSSFKKIETDDFEELFAEFVKWKDLKKNEENIVLIIDEFSYIIELSGGVPSVFQKIWDLHLKDRDDIYLVLCGSSIGLMKNEVLGRNSPLYGRRTGQWKVNDMEITHIKKFLPKYSFEDILRTYGIVGGVPLYLNKWNSSLTIEENIKKEFITKGGFFLEEAKNLLREDFREPRNYMLILSAISDGNNRFGQIANCTGLDKSALSRYLEILQTLDIVTFEIPLFSSLKEKKRHYLIKDNYFNFWFRFIYNNVPKIEANREKEVLYLIKTQFNSYFGFIFEEITKQFLIKNKSCNFTKLGRWWHKDKEIDIVGIDELKKEILFIECKWMDLSKNNALNILEKLKQKVQYVDWHNDSRKDHFGLIAKKIENKAELRKQGFFAWDLDDFKENA